VHQSLRLNSNEGPGRVFEREIHSPFTAAEIDLGLSSLNRQELLMTLTDSRKRKKEFFQTLITKDSRILKNPMRRKNSSYYVLP